jgi:hypothetical protein
MWIWKGRVFHAEGTARPSGNHAPPCIHAARPVWVEWNKQWRIVSKGRQVWGSDLMGQVVLGIWLSLWYGKWLEGLSREVIWSFSRITVGALENGFKEDKGNSLPWVEMTYTKVVTSNRWGGCVCVCVCVCVCMCVCVCVCVVGYVLKIEQ